MEKRRESKEEGHKTELSNNKRIAFICRLKNEQECIIRFKKFLHLIIQDCEFFCTASKSSDVDQLILALIFLDLGLFWSKKLDVKFSRVYIRYKDTY